MKRKKVDDFDWHPDFAASGKRHRAFYPHLVFNHPVKYTLCAYEDGRYFIDYEGVTFASGTAKTLKQAKSITVILFNHDRATR